MEPLGVRQWYAMNPDATFLDKNNRLVPITPGMYLIGRVHEWRKTKTIIRIINYNLYHGEWNAEIIWQESFEEVTRTIGFRPNIWRDVEVLTEDEAAAYQL